MKNLAGFAFVFLAVLVAVPVNSLTGQQSDPYAGEVDDGRSFGEVLAAEMTGSISPPDRLVARFNHLLDDISETCSESREWVSDRILGGHQMLTRRGGNASLMDVAAGWNEAVSGVRNPDCQSVLAAVLVQLEPGGR